MLRPAWAAPPGWLGACHRHRYGYVHVVTIGRRSPVRHHPERNARILLSSIESAPGVFYKDSANLCWT